MIAMFEQLIARDLAYQAEDKSVYYRIKNFPSYGHLAHFDLAQLQSTGRVRNDEYDKEHIGDFALWKAWDEEDGDVAWESPWGRGRPGWHIECLVTRSTFIAAVSTTSSRTTKRRSRRRKA
jgi:cysteinyl-tRNA synthetase